MHLRWTEPAELDLEAIGEYYREESGERIAAKNMLTLIEAVESLVTMPDKARPGRIPGTRELVIQSLPYIVPYRVVSGEIQILRVFHTSRKLPSSW